MSRGGFRGDRGGGGGFGDRRGGGGFGGGGGGFGGRGDRGGGGNKMCILQKCVQLHILARKWYWQNMSLEKI